MTLFSSYIRGITDALEAAAGFPAVVERSPVRAATRDEARRVCVLPGAESVESTPLGRATREREILVNVHTSGDDHLDLAEETLAAVHPIVMLFSAEGIVSIREHGTDEPKYANADLRRQVVTKRYRITYQTDEHSLSV